MHISCTYNKHTPNMVKNTGGGKKNKATARKENIKRQTALRVPEESGEIYAQAVKVLGGSIASAIDLDGNPLRAHIRGKFRGRNKRGNFISPGVWLLVGLHTWEAGGKRGEPRNCDVLEVYTDSDKNRLKMTETHVDWSKFVANDTNLFGEVSADTEAAATTVDALFEFADEATREYDTLVRANQASSNKQPLQNDVYEDEVNVDDI